MLRAFKVYIFPFCRIEIAGDHTIKYSNAWIRGDHMDMKRWKPNQICPYGIGFGDIVDGGYFMLARIQLLQLKLKLLGIGTNICIIFCI